MTNKVLTFLKKAGQILAAGAEIAVENIPALAPFIKLLPAKDQTAVTGVVNTVSSDAQLLLNAVTAAETAGAALGTPGLTGAQKAVIAGSYIGPIFLSAEGLAGKKIANPQAANAAFVTIAGGIADLLNSVDQAAIPINPPATPSTPTTPTAN